MFPDGDTKVASLTALGEDNADAGGDDADVGGEEADAGGNEAAADGASPIAAFVAIGSRVGGESGVPPEAVHAARAAVSVSAPHSPAHPRPTAM
jgi:hypothetical protein